MTAQDNEARRPFLRWLRSLPGLKRSAPVDPPDSAPQDDETPWLPTIDLHAHAPSAAPELPARSFTVKERTQYVVLSDQTAKQNTTYPSDKCVPSQAPPFHWGPHTWRQIEWQRQLVVVANLFRQVGFEPRLLSAVGLTGADVLLSSGSGQLLLRCVATRAGVSLPDMQAFARSKHARGLAHATYATGGHFSAEAREHARAHQIHTLDGEQLLALIATRTPEQQDSLLQAAYAGAYWRPSCIRCNIKLKLKLRESDHRPQWACPNAPGCPVTLPLDMAQLSRLS